MPNKSGSQIASSFVKREKDVSKTISTEKLFPGSAKQSTVSSGVGKLDKELDTIDNTLFSLIEVSGSGLKSQQNKFKKKRVRKERKKKKTREEVLESTRKFLGVLGSKVPKPVKNIWDKLKNFISNIAIGSLLLFILNNWNKVIEVMNGAMAKLRELFEKLEPILTPIWNFTKWMVVKSVELTARLVGVEDADKNTLLKNIGEITKKSLELFGLFKGVEKFVSDLKGGKDTTQTSQPTTESSTTTESSQVGVGAGVVEKMFPKSEQSEAQKGSDAVNKFFGHEVDGDQSSEVVPSKEVSPKEVSSKEKEVDWDNLTKEQEKNGGISIKGRNALSAAELKEVTDHWEKEYEKRLAAYKKNDSKITKHRLKVAKIQLEKLTGKVRHDVLNPLTVDYRTLKHLKDDAKELESQGVTIINKPKDVSKGLDTQLPYEMSQGNTNIFVTKRTSVVQNNQSAGPTVIPIPLLNTSGEVASDLYLYELTTV